MKSTVLLASVAALGGVSASMDVMETMEQSYLKLVQEGFYEEQRELGHASVLNQEQNCVNGKVTINGEDFPCDEVDFLSFLGMDDLEIPYPAHRDSVGARTSDIWGWLSPKGREFTLLTLDNGAVVIDSSDSSNPCIIAKMPTRRVVDIWADVKIYNNTMYHVKDTKYFTSLGLANEPNSTAHYGIETYDLLPFDQLNCHVDNYIPLMVWPNNVFYGHGRSHNLVVNANSGLLFSVGTERCNGGFLILDIKTNRLKPTEAGCAYQDNYTHDGQCITYNGPDSDYTGHEICFGFNEDTLTIWDFTDLNNFKLVSRTFYPNQAFSHQGWVSHDLTKVLLDDELDEICNNGNPTGSRRCAATSTYLTGVKTTITNVFDITDLDNPFYEGYFDHEDPSVDHNLYVWGNTHKYGWDGNPKMNFHPDPNYAYMNNYLAGLKIVDIHSDDFREWTTAGFFDIAPEKTTVEFAGAWSGYMHASGAYAISSIERGVFFLYPRMAYTDEYPREEDPIAARGINNSGSGKGSDVGMFFAAAATIFAIAAVIAGLVYESRKKPANTNQEVAVSSE